MNLFEEFNNIVDSTFVSKIAALVPDEKPENVQLAVDGVFNTLVAGLIRRTNSDMSSGMLYNQINENFSKVNYINDFQEKSKDKSYIEKCITDGSKVISQIFPAYKSPLLSLVSGYAGTSKNTSVLVSSITSLVLVDILGGKVTSSKLDKVGLINFLREHHEELFEKMPEGLPEKMIPALGLQELTNAKSYQAKKVEANPTKNVGEETGTFKLDVEDDEESTYFNKKAIIGVIGALILGIGGYFVWANKDNISFLNGSADKVDEELVFADSLKKVVVDTVKTDTLVAPKVDSVKKSSASASDFLKFREYVDNSASEAGSSFEFNSITYEGETINLTETSNPALDSLADLMLAKPRLQIKVTAFSAAGNQMLNNKRAFAVKKHLIAKGVEGIRIDAVSGGNGGNSPKIKVVIK
jgi:outer membrane protein OmpA-like peptidoglycan-associated protein